eukprot:6188193-Pleurochrysis_carterae.AAC.5
MRDSEARLREQLAALSTRRPLQYQWRLQTLSAMDPTSNLCQPKTMRQGVAAIDARYRRAFTPPPSKTQVTGSRRLNGSASAGMLSLPGAGWRALREHDVHHHRRSSRTGSMSAAAFLQRELQPSGMRNLEACLTGSGLLATDACLIELVSYICLSMPMPLSSHLLLVAAVPLGPGAKFT